MGKKIILAIAIAIVLSSYSEAITSGVCNVSTSQTVQYTLYNVTGATWVQSSWSSAGVTEIDAPDGYACYSKSYTPTAGSAYIFYWKCSTCSPVVYAQEYIGELQNNADITTILGIVQKFMFDTHSNVWAVTHGGK